MTAQLKQRIVGIIVLIFLALVILPWLFTEHKPLNKKNPEKSTFPTVEEQIPPKPTQSFNTIPKPDPVKQNNPSSNINNDDLLQIGKTEKLKTPAPVPITKPSINPVKISNIENQIVHNNNLQNPKRNTKNKVKEKLNNPKKLTMKLPLANNKENTSSTPKVVKITMKAKTQQNAGWAVQLGSFSTKANADKLVKQLKSKGFLAFIKTGKNSKGIAITRVYVGPEAEHALADETVNKIQKTLNIHGVVVKSSL